jgi:hypothetical protein
MALLIEAGQMTASDYVPKYPDLMLASEGASTDAIPDRCLIDFRMGFPFPGANGCLRGHRTAVGSYVSEPS